jgi:hypothetical protein
MGIGIEWFEDDIPRMREFDAVARRSQAQTMMAKVRVTGRVRQKSKPDWVGLRPYYLDMSEALVLEAYPIA